MNGNFWLQHRLSCLLCAGRGQENDDDDFVCFDHRLFTSVTTPKGVDFCVHGRLYSRLKGSRAPSSGRRTNDLSVKEKVEYCNEG